MTFDAVFTSKKVRMVRMMLFLLSLMDQSSMARVTLVAPVSTQQAQLAPVGAAALLS